MAERTKRPALVLRDNVPAGCGVSLAGIPGAVSFVAMFREELQARGFGVAPVAKERKRRGRAPEVV